MANLRSGSDVSGTLRPQRDDPRSRTGIALHVELAAEERWIWSRTRAGRQAADSHWRRRASDGGAERQRGLPWLTISRDVGFGCAKSAAIRRSPASHRHAGARIGVNTAMFSAVDAVLIRPLPYADAAVSHIWTTTRVGPVPRSSSPPTGMVRVRATTRVHGYRCQSPGTGLSNDGEPESWPPQSYR